MCCNFEDFLLPEELQTILKPPRVLVDDPGWAQICEGLVSKGICDFWEAGALHHVGGAPLLNLLFAVSKDEQFTKEDGSWCRSTTCVGPW